MPGVNSLDDLGEEVEGEQMAMQAVMDSMSAEQREQLRDMIDQLIGDDRLRVDLAELAMNLEAVAPFDARTQFPLSGDEPLSLGGAMGLMGTLQAMDHVEAKLAQGGASPRNEGRGAGL